MKQYRVGVDSKGCELNIGDICKFKIEKQEYEGMIMYDEDVFAYVFEMKNDKFPCVKMSVAELGSIERTINVCSTKLNDECEFYRELWKTK